MAGMTTTASVTMTVDEWVDHFLASDRERQRRIAQAAMHAMEQSERCWMGNHEAVIERLREQRKAALAACQSISDAPLSPSGGLVAGGIIQRVSAALGATIWPS